MRLTSLAHERLAPRMGPGDLAVDATAGNGHDTLFLARAVGDAGRVWAFDIQSRAIEATRERLAKHGVENRVTLVHASNASLARALPPDARGKVAVVMANLGYLPGGDTAVITRQDDTLAMLDAAFDSLRPGGTLSVLAYPGHAGGDTESAAVHARLLDYAAKANALEVHGDPASPERRPWLALLVKSA